MENNSIGCLGIFILTILIFFASALIIGPVMSNLGYSSVEGSYHVLTHALIVSLLLTIMTCTKIIVDKIDKLMDKIDHQDLK